MSALIFAAILTVVAVFCQKADIKCHICIGTLGSACFLDGKSTQVLPCKRGSPSTKLLLEQLDYKLENESIPESYYCGYFQYSDYYYEDAEVLRTCFYAYQNICQLLTQKGEAKSYRIQKCLACDVDYCNGTRTIDSSINFGLLILSSITTFATYTK